MNLRVGSLSSHIAVWVLVCVANPPQIMASPDDSERRLTPAVDGAPTATVDVRGGITTPMDVDAMYRKFQGKTFDALFLTDEGKIRVQGMEIMPATALSSIEQALVQRLLKRATNPTTIKKARAYYKKYNCLSSAVEQRLPYGVEFSATEVVPVVGRPATSRPSTKRLIDEAPSFDSAPVCTVARRGKMIKAICHFHNHPMATPLSHSDVSAPDMVGFLVYPHHDLVRGVPIHEYAVAKGKRRVYVFHHGRIPSGWR